MATDPRGSVLVLGTDFSPLATRALVEARTLAGGLGLTVEIVHVRDGGGADGGWAPDPRATHWLADVSERLVVRIGTPWIEIIRYAQERGARLLVAGTHGQAGFQPLGLGGTASRLATLSPRPVVLVGPRTRAGDPAEGE